MNYRLEPDARLTAAIGALDPSSRAEVEHAGAYSLSVLVRRWVNAYARRHHATANRLGASPTRHMEDGSAAITCTGSTVAIPIPGYSRAFHGLDITPKRAKALTIPISPISYGVRAGRLEAEGWDLFTVKGRDGSGVLYGQKSGEDQAFALYLLRRKVSIPQDRTMLPPDVDMQKAGAEGVLRAIMRRTA